MSATAAVLMCASFARFAASLEVAKRQRLITHQTAVALYVISERTPMIRKIDDDLVYLVFVANKDNGVPPSKIYELTRGMCEYDYSEFSDSGQRLAQSTRHP